MTVAGSSAFCRAAVLGGWSAGVSPAGDEAMKDPIVEETRVARRQLDAEFGGDLETLFAYLCAIERQTAAKVVKLDRKPTVTVPRRNS